MDCAQRILGELQWNINKNKGDLDGVTTTVLVNGVPIYKSVDAFR